MELPKDLLDEIWNYCRLNKITNIDEFTTKLVKQGFTIEKYGATPQAQVVEKIVEKVITNDDEVKKLHEELQIEKNKNIELTKQLEEKQKRKDIYGES